MRLVTCLLLLLATVIPSSSQSLTIILLPPPLPSVNDKSQNALTSALPMVWQKVLGKWEVVTFHRESPSLQRALREKIISPKVLFNPYEHAKDLCAAEGAKAAFWVRVKKVNEDLTPQEIEARLLSPLDVRFETNLAENPVTEEERKALRPISGKNPPAPHLVLTLRLGQWLLEQLKPFLDEVEQTQQILGDMKTVNELMAGKRWNEAIQILSRMVTESPQDPNLYLLLGQAYEGKQKLEDALMEYRRAVYLQSDLWEAWKGVARVASQMGRWEITLMAVRQLRRMSEVEPHYLALGAKAATNLASSAQKRGREKEGETLRKEATELDSLLMQSTSDFSLILDATERLYGNQEFKLAAEALTKLVTQLPQDQSAAERVLRLAWMLRRFEIAFPFLVAFTSSKEKVTFGRDAFRFAVSVLDAESAKLFEQVRNSLFAFDSTKLTRDDLLNRLKQVNSSADQLLRIAHKIQAPEPFVKIHNRRLLCYELFLQATELLLQWVEQPDDLTRRRAVVLYEFARNELEQAWREERVLR